MNYIITIIMLISYIFPKCDGFNWYHDIDSNDCNKSDIKVLQQFIDNSQLSINFEMDINLDNIIQPLELGWQLWENGRLIHWICDDVPSPFYVYNYDCNLSGNIPDDINELDYIIKLHLQNNQLEGIIPESICSLNISKTNRYWFKINNNNFCPPYPDCLGTWNINHNKKNCD